MIRHKALVLLYLFFPAIYRQIRFALVIDFQDGMFWTGT